MGKLILIFILLSTQAFGKTHPPTVLKKSKKKIKELKKSILQHDKKIINLRKSIESLESSLGDKNKKFLRTSVEKNKVEKQLISLKRNQDQNEKILSKLEEEINISLESMVVAKLNSSNTMKSLIERELLSNMYTSQSNLLARLKLKNSHLATQVLALERSYRSFDELEGRLTQIIIDLEDRKRRLADSYLEESRAKSDKSTLMERYQVRLKKNRPKAKKTKKIGRNLKEILAMPYIGKMISPVLGESKTRAKGEGIEFSSSSDLSLRAPLDGTVAYAGSLGSYGNLIIFDHGREIRTILLGDVDARLTKGMKVQQGQIVGVAKNYQKPEKKVYFEVRMKNKAQESAHWLKTSERKQITL